MCLKGASVTSSNRYASEPKISFTVNEIRIFTSHVFRWSVVLLNKWNRWVKSNGEVEDPHSSSLTLKSCSSNISLKYQILQFSHRYAHSAGFCWRKVFGIANLSVYRMFWLSYSVWEILLPSVIQEQKENVSVREERDEEVESLLWLISSVTQETTKPVA